MKKLIGIAGAFFLVYVIVTSAAAPAGQTAVQASERSSQTVFEGFTAREENDRIVILSGDSVMLKTDTRVSGLPKIDRMRLREGVYLGTEEELKAFIEDYCS